jgi:predicted small secreted protein
MKAKLLSTALVASILSIGLPVIAQSSAQTNTDPGFKQDMKSAGHSTKNATKDTGNGVKSGTKKTWNGTKNTTKKATHKTAQKTDEGANKVEQKTSPNQ